MLIAEKIKTNLTNNLKPVFLNIKNESSLHHGSHGTETHFRIEIVSEAFQGKKMIERHQSVQNILKNELVLVKAFSLYTFTVEEWEVQKMKLSKSPACRGSDHA